MNEKIIEILNYMVFVIGEVKDGSCLDSELNSLQKMIDDLKSE